MVCHLPFGPTAYFTLYNVVMRHDVPDIGTMSEAYPHLIFHNFTSRLGKRVSKWVLDHALYTCHWYSVTTCLCIQLINSARTGIEYPQVSFSSAEGGQQACHHIRQPRGLHHFQVSVKGLPQCKYQTKQTLRWPGELNPLQLKKTCANRQNTSKLRQASPIAQHVHSI